LDFTLLDAKITQHALKEAFDAVFEDIKEEVNITLSMSDFGEHETENINFYINYVGPLGGSGANKQVKVDISLNELLLFDIKEREMFEKYSDHKVCCLKCYSLEEIITEKLRSLLSRQQPRDFYDLWYMSEYEEINLSDYVAEFKTKAQYKGLNPVLLESRIEKISPVFKSRWDNSLQEQIKDLPPFEQVARELGRHFRRLFKQ
jgi:predicted nucleotidyltransferase component of viral defense system